jgi:hypothetical protein
MRKEKANIGIPAKVQWRLKIIWALTLTLTITITITLTPILNPNHNLLLTTPVKPIGPMTFMDALYFTISTVYR